MSDPVARVLERLDGARRAGRGWIARCPGHDDRSPSLSITQGDDGRVLVKCFAGCSTEAVAAAIELRLPDLFADANRRDTYHPPAPSPTRSARPKTVPPSPAALGALIADLSLGPLGEAELRRRGIEPELGRAYGLRSAETGADRALVRHHLAGWWPAHWSPAALVIPYMTEAEHVAHVRLRRLDGDTRPRYLCPPGGAARIPWRLEALGAPRPLELVVVEGELDALVLVSRGIEAIATGGAAPGPDVLYGVVSRADECARLVIWSDDDKAGDTLAEKLTQLLADRWGPSWVRSHVRRRRSAHDACELAAAGAL